MTHALQDRATRLLGTIERRQVLVTEFEMRATPDSAVRDFTGHPSLFNAPYAMYGGPDNGGWMETVNAKAFDRTLRAKPDVVLNVDHGDSLSGMPIARSTAPGPVAKLILGTDKRGLTAATPLDPTADDDVRQLSQKMDLGLIDQMSFAFRTVRQAWNDDYTERELLELDLNRGDVSIVTNGANPATSGTLRSALEMLAGADVAELVEMRGTNADRFLAAHKVLADALETRVDPDEDPGAVAQAIDAALDAAQEQFTAGNVDQGIALVAGAEISVDALLALLGVTDADDARALKNERIIRSPKRSLAHAKRLLLLDA